MLSLQQGAGNAAVSRMVLARQVPPVAPPAPAAVHHTKAELDAMTLTDFDAYATDQADWATEPNRPAATPAMPEDYKRKLRRLLEYAREDDGGRQPILAGCGGMTVQDLIATGLDGVVRNELRHYGRAVAQSTVTVQLGSTTDVARARQYGRALEKLEAHAGPGRLAHDLQADRGRRPARRADRLRPPRRLHRLLPALPPAAGGRQRRRDPLLPRAAGRGRRSGHATAAAPGRAQHPPLPEGAARRGRPQPEPHAQGQAALPDPALGVRPQRRLPPRREPDRGVHRRHAPDADDRGQGVAGRDVGRARAAREEVRPGQQDPAGDDRRARQRPGDRARRARWTPRRWTRAAPTPTPSRATDLTSSTGATADTDRFMAELLRNMANDPSARIVLNGCLTASNSVNAPLDADPATAAQQVHDAISAEPSLQTYLGAAGRRRRQRGAGARRQRLLRQGRPDGRRRQPGHRPGRARPRPAADRGQGRLHPRRQRAAGLHAGDPGGLVAGPARQPADDRGARRRQGAPRRRRLDQLGPADHPHAVRDRRRELGQRGADPAARRRGRRPVRAEVRALVPRERARQRPGRARERRSSRASRRPRSGRRCRASRSWSCRSGCRSSPPPGRRSS